MTNLHDYMSLALKQAQLALLHDEIPVGALIVDAHDNVIASAFNQNKNLNDPTAHAEIISIRQASAYLKTPVIPSCKLFVTLEPCPMCLHAISLARISQTFFGAYRTSLHSTISHNKSQLIGGVMEQQCSSIITDFFHKKRIT